jgi:hypothetical protein
LQARHSATIGAALLFLLALGMTVDLRRSAITSRALALVTEHRPAARYATSNFEPLERVRRLPIRPTRRAPVFMAMPVARPNIPESTAIEMPTEPPPVPAVAATTLDLTRYAAEPFAPVARTPLRIPTRPRSLVPLYATFAALQVADAVTTVQALQQAGVEEVNPLARPFVRNVPAMAVVKSASTAVTIFAVEKLWRRNRVAAVSTMIGINVAYGLIVSHNARVAESARRAP